MNMQQGTILTDSHIIYHRPGTGIPPKLNHYVIGKKLKTHLEVGQLIQMEDLE
jgi:sialic acid synthase SpsE